MSVLDVVIRVLDARKRVLDIVSPYIKELSFLCISVLETVKKCKRHLNRGVTISKLLQVWRNVQSIVFSYCDG